LSHPQRWQDQAYVLRTERWVEGAESGEEVADESEMALEELAELSMTR